MKRFFPQDKTPDNPVKELRVKAKPNADEIRDRSPRDKTRPGLLQHEMARRLKCSTSTIRDLERDKKMPSNEAIQNNFWSLYDEVNKNQANTK